MPLALEAREITKRFAGVVACDAVDFDLRRGEIHGLLGENGAGKTTLMNVFCGLCRPDAGRLAFDGEPARLAGPRDAIARGLGMVHQHFVLVPPLTVAENVMLGRESARPGLRGLGVLAPLDRRSVAARIRELSRRHGLAVDPDARVEDLSVGARQRVEIVKALYRDARTLIFDEPTAVLTPREADDLCEVMRALAREGAAVVFITHKLREVLGVADRISVMRGGRMVGTVGAGETSAELLAGMMIGRALPGPGPRAAASPGAVVLGVEALRVQQGDRVASVDAVSLEVRAGEIIGIAGVLGNGQRELVEAIAGLRPVRGGSVRLAGEDVTGATPRQIVERGVGHVPEDRGANGLVQGFSVSDNLALRTYYREPFAHGWELDEPRLRREAEALVREHEVRTPGVETRAGDLSGGNQQKLVLAREFARPLKLLILEQPTRGLDIASVAFVHQRILAARDRGVAVLLVSAELDEVLALADRIAVMFGGRLVETLDARGATRERLGLLMAGAAEAGVA